MTDLKLALFAAFVALQIADVYSTHRALQRSGVMEANYIVRWLMDQLGELPGLALPKVLYCIVLWLALPYFPAWLLAALVALYALVVASNWQVAHGRPSLFARVARWFKTKKEKP